MTLGPTRAPARLVVASGLTLAAALVLAASHRERARDAWHAVVGLPLPTLAAALLLVLLQLGCQACRLWTLVPRDAGLTLWRAARAFAVGEWANIVAPARAGDALKIVLLSRAATGAHPTSIAAATGAVLADKLVDAGSFITLSAVAAWATGLAAAALQAPLPGPAAVLVAGLAGVLVVSGIKLTGSRWFERLARWHHELGKALAVLLDPRSLVPSVCSSFGAWIAETLALRLLTNALGFAVPLPHLVLALAALNLGISVPVTLGNVGVYEGVLALGLSRAGVPLASAVAIATVHHALELLGTNVGAAALSVGVARPRSAGTPSSVGGRGG